MTKKLSNSDEICLFQYQFKVDLNVNSSNSVLYTYINTWAIIVMFQWWDSKNKVMIAILYETT